MVDFPDPEDSAEFDFDRGSDGMPDRTQRAFQAHADQELGDRPGEAIAEIERVYRADSDAAVSVSGGKDSMTTLVLAAESNAAHRALHWDYGPEFVPRDTAQPFVDAIEQYTPRRRIFVANEAMSVFQRLPDATAFRRQLNTTDRLSTLPSLRGTDKKGVTRLAPRLKRTIEDGLLGRQILGVRRGESGARERKVDGLYGESLGHPAAYPIRDWSARDVWAFLVDRDVPYPDHYDRVAAVINDGSPRAYERVRMSMFFRDMGNSGRYQKDTLAAWRDQDIMMDNS